MGAVNSRMNGRVSPVKITDTTFDNKQSKPSAEETTKQAINPISTRFTIIWLDAKVTDADHAYQDTIFRLQRITNSFQILLNVEDCQNYLRNVKNESILMVISSELLPDIWPTIRTMPQIHSVYLLSPNGDQTFLIETNSNKFKGIFTKVEPICGSVQRNHCPYREDVLVVSVIPANRYDRNDLKRLNHIFLYWMMAKLIIRTSRFDKDTHKQAIKDLTALCRTQYMFDKAELKVIDEFEKNYEKHTPIWWYTRYCFLSSMLDQAFQTRDIEVIIRMSFFIKDLCQEMEKIQNEAEKKVSLPITVYRSQQVTDDDFKKMQNIQGNLLSFNNFFLADTNYQRSLDLIETTRDKNQSVTILFCIKIESKKTSGPYALLKNLSYESRHEDYFLFSIHSIFRVEQIQKMNEQVYQIDIVLTSIDNEHVGYLTELLRQETRTQPNWFKLAHLLTKMGYFDQARDVYYALIGLLENEPLKKAQIYNELGLIEDELGNYSAALGFYQRAMDIREQHLPSNHRLLSVSQNNIGEVQRQLGDYSSALKSHQKTLRIKRKVLSADDLSLATTYNNIGLANEALGEFTTALGFYQRCLNTKLKSLPSDHQELAISYNNIGELYRLMGNYPLALQNFEQALRIRLKKYLPEDPVLGVLYNNLGLIHRELGNYPATLSYLQKSLQVKLQSLPQYHPSFTFTYNNIGDLQQQLGEYANALVSYKKALEIQEKSLVVNHPELATTLINMGAANQSMGQYQSALSFYERALEIRLKTLPHTHPSLATCYNNIGHVHEAIGNYSSAMENYLKTLHIQEKSLPRHHPLVASTYNNLADINRKMKNEKKALEFYKKSLDIKKKSLGMDHPSLIATYNNIGVLHQSMGNYPSALEYYSLTVETQKKTLPSDHPGLAAIYNNLGVTHQSMGKFSEAYECYKKALAIQERSLPHTHPDIGLTHNSLATVLLHLGDNAAALEHSKNAFEITSGTLSPEHPTTELMRDHYDRIKKFVDSQSSNKEKLQ